MRTVAEKGHRGHDDKVIVAFSETVTAHRHLSLYYYQVLMLVKGATVFLDKMPLKDTVLMSVNTNLSDWNAFTYHRFQLDKALTLQAGATVLSN